MITLGGDAELELVRSPTRVFRAHRSPRAAQVDSLDPFSEGIVFSVRPPKKSWKNIANLSGGEKTLSSLGALLRALFGSQRTHPRPSQRSCLRCTTTSPRRCT